MSEEKPEINGLVSHSEYNYIIVLDLNDEDYDYERVVDYIYSKGEVTDPMPNVFILMSEKPIEVNKLYRRIKKRLPEGDGLLIARLAHTYGPYEFPEISLS